MTLQGFDKSYYLSQKLAALQTNLQTAPDWAGKTTQNLSDYLLAYGMTPESHYQQFGWKEGLNPNQYFNSEQYVLAKGTQLFNSGTGGYSSISQAAESFKTVWGQDPYLHYLQFGALENVNPSNSFDESSYLADKLAKLQQDTKTSAAWVNKTTADLEKFFHDNGLTALTHYLQYGILEGLTPKAVPVGEAVQISQPINTVTTGHIFTLQESVVPGHAEVQPVKEIYWGYDPHGNLNNVPGAPADGGIPVAELLSFLKAICGQDFIKLGLIDADGTNPFANVTNLTISNAAAPTTNQQTGANGGTNEVIVTFADGTITNAEASLGNDYLGFLSDLLFDSNGNSRLFEHIVPGTGSSATSATLQPIVLTTTVNNGGTVEDGFTTSLDDTIVAGRLELLHGAYIDAGAGYDILEVDAKGVYAQPKQLLNIEEIRVQNMANVYTTADIEYKLDGSGNLLLVNGQPVPVLDANGNTIPIGGGYLHNSTYPLLSGDGAKSSFLDITRATSIKKLVVTEADDFIGGSGANTVPLGPLTIVGIRNDAVTRLEGNFSQDVTLQYGQGINGTLELELALGDVTSNINLLQNAAVVNIDSQGVVNHMHQFFAGGSVSRMNIKGTGVFAVEENLADSLPSSISGGGAGKSSFNASHPVIIDASANTGGLDITLVDGSGSGDLGFSNVKVIGTVADDEITVSNIKTADANGNFNNAKVVIQANNGDNTIIADNNDFVTITSGTGNDLISAQSSINVNVAAGDGANVIRTDNSKTVVITAGVGNDVITSNSGTTVTIDAGAGNNTITANSMNSTDAAGVTVPNSAQLTVTTLDGNDTITAVGDNNVTINAGAGTNKITVSALQVNITTGDGNDTVKISGRDGQFDFGDQGDVPTPAHNAWNDTNYVDNQHFIDTAAPGALFNLALGAGINTVYLGRDIDSNGDGVINNTVVGGITDAQLGVTALEGSTITGTGIKLFVENSSDLTEANLDGATITSVTLKQELRITDQQFTKIGSAAFNVLQDEEGATEDLYIVIGKDATESVTLSSLVNLATLSTNVRLHFELHNGSTLTLTAEQLHKYVSWHGIDSTDGLNGKVVITDAGQNFDPFDNGNNYQVIDGGSLTDTFDASEDVTILRKLDGGFERPVPSPSTDTLVLDSNVDGTIDTPINSEVATLKIKGTADITFAHTVNLGRDVGAALLADGTLGDLVAPETDAFTIDFSAPDFTGHVHGLVLANFQDVKKVMGNGTATDPVRIDVELTNGSSVGSAGNANGLNSTGVQTYVVTAIGDDSVGEDAAASSATFYVCDMSKGVTTLGLRGNYNDTINFEQVNWGTNFLLEGGGTAKADGNPSFANVGFLHADYFWQGAEPHATSVVNIVNLDTGTIRPLFVAGIDVDYADSITVNVTGSDAVIGYLSGNSAEKLFINDAGNVTLLGDLATAHLDSKGLKVLDASGVTGTFTLKLNDAVATTTDLSKTTVTGLDKVVFDTTAQTLTLTVDQALTLGAANVTTTAGVGTSTLNFENLGNQSIDMTAFGVKDIGTVSIADNVGLVQLAPTTVLGNALNNADSLLIKAALDATTVEMTAAQFNQLAGTGTVTSNNGTDTSTGKDFVSTLVLTDITATTKVDLAAVDQSAVDATPHSNVTVVVKVGDLVATSATEISNGTATLEVTGNVDLTKAGSLSSIKSVKLDAGAVLTLTAAQVAAITLTDTTPADGIADNWVGLAGSKLNITDIENGFALDLTQLTKAGIDIGTLTLKDSNGDITLGAAANLADADSIITPTKDLNDAVDGIEPTTLHLTAAQFNQLAGTGTITGDGKVFITALANNIDINGDIIINNKDAALIDVSGITAPKGTVDLGGNPTTVTLDPTSSLAGFEILLTNGQMIRFNTQAQASGAKITEVNPGSDVTAVEWLFSTITGPVDTSKYNATINHLYILNTLLDGVAGHLEESLWTTLASSIVVEKFSNATIPDVLVGFARINTFEALESVPNGVNYDNQTELESTQTITMNLEGNVTIGNVTIGDTVGTGLFDSLTINSYEDRTSLDARGLSNVNYVFQPNKVGDIGLNTGSADNLVHVNLNTYASVDNVIGTADDAQGFLDVVNVNAVVGERDGLALEVGKITFAATATTEHPTTDATLNITGSNNVKIAGIDISDAEVNLLTIDASAHVADALAPTLAEPTLVIGGILPTGGSDASNALGSFDHIYVMDGYTAPAAAFGTAGNNLLVVQGGANDLTKATATDIDQVHFTANGSLTLTAAQVAAISQADGPDPDLAADAWSTLAGLNVTLNITEMSTEVLDLAKIAAAGINIGTITIKDTNAAVTLNPATTLGDADSIIVPPDTTLNLTALQFDQLAGIGTITASPLGTGDTLLGIVNITNLHNTLDNNDVDTVADDFTFLDVSNVTATHGTITLDANDVSVGDIAMNIHSILGKFSITLNDVDSNPAIDNELAGQTIRFSTALQAERAIIIVGADNDAGGAYVAGSAEYFERDTNVVWMFNTITGTVTAGKINTHDYSGALGRVWVNDVLVNGQNVEDIFSSPSAIQTNPTTGLVNLNSTTIIRVENTADLATLLPENQGVDRHVEVTAFTQLPAGLIFNNPDKLVSVENLTIDLGGNVNIGHLSIDDIVAAAIIDDNHFGTLTINSKLASAAVDTYLLPHNFDPAVNPYPSALVPNVIGDISSGPTRDQLAHVVINATGETLNTGTITFAETTSLLANPLPQNHTATLTVTGTQNVNIVSVNTADVDITAHTLTTTGYTGILTAPGASPAFNLDNTQTFTITNGGVGNAATITITADGADNNDEVLTVSYTLNGVAGIPVAVALDASVDVTNANAVAVAVATALDALAGISATANGAVVSIYGDGSNVVNVTGVVATGTTTTLAGAGTAEVEGGTINLGTATNAGVVGNELSVINAANFGGILNLGILAQLDSSNDTADLNSDGDMNDAGEIRALTFNSGVGITTATLAAANGRTPTLNAGSEWLFDYTNADSGSYLKITPTAVFQAGSTLRLNNVPLQIEAGVDLSQLVDNPATTTYVEGLFITGGSIEVLAGGTLTLTAHQVDALRVAGVNINGAGTLNIIGDASNLTLGANIHTATVDIHSVTLIAAPTAGFDADNTVNLSALTGGTYGGNTGAAQTVLGSANMDNIATTSTGNDVITGGALNDTMTGGGGSDTYRVDAGSDTIVGLNSVAPGAGEHDVLIVSAGATANAAIAGDFYATALTTNAGTAILTGTDGVNHTINMLLAGGTNGFTIHGGNHATLGVDTLIGSNNNDIINGGNNLQTAAGAIDTLTGNGGADLFTFDIAKSNPLAPVVATTTPGTDKEQITVTADGADNGDETLTITYVLNGVASAVLIQDPLINVTSANEVASAIATVLDGQAGIAASAAANVVTVTGDGINSVSLTGAGATVGGTVTTLAAAYGAGADVAQISTIQIDATVVVGEKYTALVTLAEGQAIGVTYTASAATAANVSAGITAAFNALSATYGNPVLAADGGAGLITFTDQNSNNGGFTLSATGEGAVTGSGASALVPTLATADLITDFLTGTDTISFLNMAQGVAGNYTEAAAVADFATALANANTAMDTTHLYYLTSITGGDGLLFFDANADGTADGVVRLQGVTDASFAFSDIVHG